MADSPVAAYQVKQSGEHVRLSGQPYGDAPADQRYRTTGWLSRCRPPLKALIANGCVKKILGAWRWRRTR